MAFNRFYIEAAERRSADNGLVLAARGALRLGVSDMQRAGNMRAKAAGENEKALGPVVHYRQALEHFYYANVMLERVGNALPELRSSSHEAAGAAGELMSRALDKINYAYDSGRMPVIQADGFIGLRNGVLDRRYRLEDIFFKAVSDMNYERYLRDDKTGQRMPGKHYHEVVYSQEPQKDLRGEFEMLCAMKSAAPEYVPAPVALVREGSGTYIGYVLEHFEGKTLAEVLIERMPAGMELQRFKVRSAGRLIMEHGSREDKALLEGIHAKLKDGFTKIHMAGLAHGDLQTTNIIVNGNGEIRIIDPSYPVLLRDPDKARNPVLADVVRAVAYKERMEVGLFLS